MFGLRRSRVYLFLLSCLFMTLLFSKVLLDTDIETSTHTVLPGHRLVVDNLITQHELKALMDYSLAEQMLQTPQFDRFRKTYQNFGVVDFQDTMGMIRNSFTYQKNPHFTHFNDSAVNTFEKRISIVRAFTAVQTRIVDYAESFFKCSFKIKSGSIFLRKQLHMKADQYKSPSELNDAAGWLVPVHADDCMLDGYLLTCQDKGPTNEEKLDFLKRDVSVVAFLNSLPDEAGGEFTFIDADRQLLQERWKQLYGDEGGSEQESRSQSKNNHSRPQSKSRIDEENKKQVSHIPPPTRESIRRALHTARRAQEKHTRRDEIRNKSIKRGGGLEEGAGGDTHGRLLDDSRFVQSVVVPATGFNYTVVLPRPGRVVMFNSSVEHVHAATNLIRAQDHRYTLFMFLTVDRDD